MIKGVADPIELFEVGDARRALRRAARQREGLPRRAHRRVVAAGQATSRTTCRSRRTSFIGRERELDEVKALLGKARLLTLLGMGGLGKTRLSLQVAAELMDAVPGRRLVPRPGAAARRRRWWSREAAQVLGVREEPGRPLLQTLCAHLKPRARC